MAWRAVCTRLKTQFTVTFWFTITSNSNFIFSSFREQSELKLILKISIYSHICFLLVYNYCNMCVAQFIKTILTWLCSQFHKSTFIVIYFNYLYINIYIFNKIQELCPFRELTKHITARTDDSHAVPVKNH